MYYRIGEKLVNAPEGTKNGWRGIAAVLRPEQLAKADLPQGLLPEDAVAGLAGCRVCRLTVETARIRGELHIPAKGKHRARNLLFVWWEGSLLFVDPDGAAAECLDKVRRMRPHHADGADDLLMDFSWRWCWTICPRSSRWRTGSRRWSRRCWRTAPGSSSAR